MQANGKSGDPLRAPFSLTLDRWAAECDFSCTECIAIEPTIEKQSAQGQSEWIAGTWLIWNFLPKCGGRRCRWSQSKMCSPGQKYTLPGGKLWALRGYLFPANLQIDRTTILNKYDLLCPDPNNISVSSFYLSTDAPGFRNFYWKKNMDLINISGRRSALSFQISTLTWWDGQHFDGHADRNRLHPVVAALRLR